MSIVPGQSIAHGVLNQNDSQFEFSLELETAILFWLSDVFDRTCMYLSQKHSVALCDFKSS